MEFIKSLHTETNYDRMIVKMSDKEGINGVKSLYPGYNTKVLLSAILIKNFSGYFIIRKSDEIFKKCELICKHMLDGNSMGLSQVYPTFFIEFKKWRDEDIKGMKQEIESAHGAINDMRVDPKDEADEQWNKGIDINSNIMENTKKLLDIYGSSPPR
jgi:hypothetical protein